MVDNYIQFFKELTDKVWGISAYQTLFFLGVFVIWIFVKKKEKKSMFVWYTGIVLIGIYNPITLFLCKIVFGETELAAYYCRLFMLLPIVFTIAYAFVILLQQCKSDLKKLFATILSLLIIIASGHSIYEEDWYVKAQNFNKVPNDVLQICELVQGVENEKRIMVPNALTTYMRQVDTSIKLVYDRYQGGEEIVVQVSSETPNVEFILEYGKEYECNYVVCLKNDYVIENFSMKGCKIAGYTDNYVLIELI